MRGYFYKTLEIIARVISVMTVFGFMCVGLSVCYEVLKKFAALFSLLLITTVGNGCTPEPCPKPEPKLFTTCVNGVSMWQNINGDKGIMIKLGDGFKPMACK